MTAPPVGRFAPSPTGRMHAGNIFSALVGWLLVKSVDGQMVLRIEDLDRERSKPVFADAVQRDLEMLGLTWDSGPFHQTERDEAYACAYARIEESFHTYPCFCTRADLAVASAPHLGEKRVYPGTCSLLSAEDAQKRMDDGIVPAWRVEVPEVRIGFHDVIQGPYAQELDADCGDFILRRKDGAFAYQLAVVVDDADEGVTSVTRGVDLLSSTPQQIFLQKALGYSEPTYAHVPLLVAQDGRRLSKRDRDASLDEMLVRFGSAEGVIGHIAYITGLQPEDAPASPSSLLNTFHPEELPELWGGKISIPWQ